MTRLQLIRSLYGTGLVLQLGHQTHGLYPLKWIGRIILHKLTQHGFAGEYDGIPIYRSDNLLEENQTSREVVEN